MSFNRRGPDRRSDRPDRSDRSDRPPQRRGDWQPRDRGGERQFPPRDRGGERPYGGRDRYSGPPRSFDRPADEGGMSIRLDPRRLGTLKQLAAEAGVRPGDLVRQWVEERIDASRGGAQPTGAAGADLVARLERLEARIDALEGRTSAGGAASEAPAAVAEPTPQAAAIKTASTESSTNGDGPSGIEPSADEPRLRRRRSATAAPSGPRVGLHDEMIAVIAERGPLTAAELAEAIVERGRYAPPRSGKSLDATTVSQRASNPTYRARFVRREGRIGLAQAADEG